MKLVNVQKGLTIVEMLVYMAIFSILFVVLLDIFFSAIDTQQESKATSSVDQDGDYILARLHYDISRSQSITLPSTYGLSGSTLSIQIGGSAFVYSTDTNHNLNVTNSIGTNQLNSPDTTMPSISFIRYGNPGGKDTVQISFQVQSKNKRTTGLQMQSFSTVAGLR